MQQYGVDYTEVFAPMARLDTILLILAIATQYSWNVFQLDVKSVFLHGELKEEIYVQQPNGFVKKGEEEKVYKLKKALYDLCEHTLFTKSKEGGKILIVSCFVDDLIYTGNDGSMCDEFRRSMMTEFDMSDLGKMRYFLGIKVMQNSSGIFIC